VSCARSSERCGSALSWSNVPGVSGASAGNASRPRCLARRAIVSARDVCGGHRQNHSPADGLSDAGGFLRRGGSAAMGQRAAGGSSRWPPRRPSGTRSAPAASAVPAEQAPARPVQASWPRRAGAALSRCPASVSQAHGHCLTCGHPAPAQRQGAGGVGPPGLLARRLLCLRAHTTGYPCRNDVRGCKETTRC
jgi:hypothetical protein